MNDSTSQAVVSRIFITFVLTLVVLFVGFTLLGFEWGIALAFVVSALCGVLGAAKAIEGGFRDDPPASTGLRWSAAIYGGLTQLLIGATFAGTVLFVASHLALVEPLAMVANGVDVAGQLRWPSIAEAIIVIVASIVSSFFLAFGLATIGPTTAGEALRRLGNRWFSVVWRQLGASLILGLGTLSVMGVAVGGVGLQQITQEMRLSTITSAWDLMAELVDMPLLLVAGAALLATHHTAALGVTNFLERIRKDVAVTESQASSAGRPLHAIATIILVALLLGSYSAIGIVRIGADSADSAVPMIMPVFALEDEVDKWLVEQSGKGMDAEASAQRLNEVGYYHSDAPDEGIVKLLPILTEAFGNFDEIVCRFDIQSGPRNMGEQEAIDKVWRDVYDTKRGDELGQTKKALTVRYCLKIVCTGQMFYGSRPVTWLISSHASANEGWSGGSSTSMVFNRIFSDGGYCTKDGALAERYLG